MGSRAKTLQLGTTQPPEVSTHLLGFLQLTCPSSSSLACAVSQPGASCKCPWTCYDGTEMAVARWDAPSPGSLPSHRLSSSLHLLQEFPGGMAGEQLGDLCKTQSVSNFLVIYHVAWQEGWLVRLHPKLTCGQI